MSTINDSLFARIFAVARELPPDRKRSEEAVVMLVLIYLNEFHPELTDDDIEKILIEENLEKFIL